LSNGFITRNRLRTRLDAAVAAFPEPPAPPVLVVDVDALDANAGDLATRAGGTPLRVATTSLRVPALICRVLERDGFSGLLAYSLREALWLHEHGITDDILLSRPTVDRSALRTLVGTPRVAAAVTLLVDSEAHLDLIDSVRASKAVPVRVAIDVDAGLRVAGATLGPKRSPLHETGDVVALARTIVGRAGFLLVGAMTCETAEPSPRSLVARRMAGPSAEQLRTRRHEIDHELRQLASLELFHAGSLETAAGDEAVTEAAAGTLLGFPRVAAFAGHPVVRRPAPSSIAVADGLSDPGAVPWAPPGLQRSGRTTTLTGHPAALLSVGDTVWFRPSDPGDAFEHTDTVHLLSGDRIIETVPTYRGTGHAFG
jgi:D-serine deaminase-like pyridoxal phosphate-dependent protein